MAVPIVSSRAVVKVAVVKVAVKAKAKVKVREKARAKAKARARASLVRVVVSPVTTLVARAKLWTILEEVTSPRAGCPRLVIGT